MLAFWGTLLDINWDGEERRKKTIPRLVLVSPNTEERRKHSVSPREEKGKVFPFFAKRKGGTAGLHFPGCQCEFE
ncbi:MAG: hypothetical protein WC870_02715 [Candidatus Paceibacterota bacterium]